MAAHSKAGTSVSASMREGLGEVAEGVTGVEEEAMEEVEEVMAEEITDAIATEVMEIVIVMEIEGMEEEIETKEGDAIEVTPGIVSEVESNHRNSALKGQRSSSFSK